MFTSRIVAVACAVLLARAAPAQIKDVEPYYAAVTRDATQMRCGDMDRFYAVAELKGGRILRVVGESKLWARVDYPRGMTAFVRADEGELQGRSVVLTKGSKLRAANLAGPTGSWKPLLPERLPEGATLDLIERVEGRNGAVFYRVRAPLGAVGYVPIEAIRRATDEEVKAAGLDALPKPATQQNPDPVEKPEAVAGAPAEQAQDQTGESLIEPMVEPGEDAEVVIDQNPPQPAEEKPDVMSLEDLDGAFKAVCEQPIAEAEIDELIGEFVLARDALDPSPLTEQLRERIDRRIAMLELRRDYQRSLQDLDETRASLSDEADALEQRIAQLQQGRAYNFIGKLVASRVYDGRRLPLMYRLQSVGPSPRTLGYIVPGDDDDLGNKLGRIVGIVGESSTDEDRGVLLIHPEALVLLDHPAVATPVRGPEE